MQRSHWDLEVYAKDFQEQRWREAARGRLADEAVGDAGRGFAGNPFNLAVARILNAWKSRFASRNTSGTPQPVAHYGVTADAIPHPSPATGGRLAQPYADMVVIARGPMAGVTEQPSGVSDS